jgi:hypothetical protein
VSHLTRAVVRFDLTDSARAFPLPCLLMNGTDSSQARSPLVVVMVLPQERQRGDRGLDKTIASLIKFGYEFMVGDSNYRRPPMQTGTACTSFPRTPSLKFKISIDGLKLC